MPWLHRSTTPPPAEPWPWWRRHKITSSLVVLALLAGALLAWRPWQHCGPGLVSAGSPRVCVGVNLESTSFRADDPLADLEQRIAQHNAKITTDDFVTVVLLDDMTPDPENDSAGLMNVRHGIEGAIAAAWRANTQPIAGGTTPPVKLLLASYGSSGAHESQAVDEIVKARDDQHIVAVAGLGQSLAATRKAASDLSDQHIAVVGSLVSGDDMNQIPGTDQYIQRFFRITPTNTDAAKAAVSFLAARNYRKVMLVQDANPHDLYAATLGTAFRGEHWSRFGEDVPYAQTFTSPDLPLNDINRAQYMTKLFADMHGEICLESPT